MSDEMFEVAIQCPVCRTLVRKEFRPGPRQPRVEWQKCQRWRNAIEERERCAVIRRMSQGQLDNGH
jgi:hypothetical protein